MEFTRFFSSLRKSEKIIVWKVRRSYWFFPLLIVGILIATAGLKIGQKALNEYRNKPYQEKYLKIYVLINSADKASSQKMDAEAQKMYQEAFEKLSEISSEKPEWEPTIVKYRLKYLKEKLGLEKSKETYTFEKEPPNNFQFSKELVDRAEKGDEKARIDLAICYLKGLGIDQDKEKALYWWQKAAEQGNQEAEFRIAVCFLQGEGVKKDEKAAFSRFLSLAEKGNTKAQFAVGNAYRNGLGVTKDEFKAIEWYKKSAQNNNADAQNLLGLAYQDGVGVSKDEVEGAKWLIRSADQGNSYGQFLAGNCYAKGTGVEKNGQKAIEYFKKADEQGYLDATFNLGYYYQTGLLGEKNQIEALKYYKKCAEKNDFESANQMGNAYYYGQGVGKNYDLATFWYTKAAKGGVAKAQFHLGYLLEKGIGTQKDLKKAKYWYEKAARKNDGDAQYALGNMYFAEDKYTRAKEFYKKAQKNKVVLANEALIILKTINLIKEGPLKNLANWGWYSVPVCLVIGLILFSGWIFVFGQTVAAYGIKIIGIILGIAGLFNYILGPVILYKTINLFQTKETILCYTVVLFSFLSGWIYSLNSNKIIKKGILLFCYFAGFLPSLAITASIHFTGYILFPKIFSNYGLFAWILFLTTFLLGWASLIKIDQNVKNMDEWKSVLQACFFSSFGLCVFLVFKIFLNEQMSIISKISLCLITILLPLGIISSLQTIRPVFRAVCLYLSLAWLALMIFSGKQIFTSQINANSYVEALNTMQKAEAFMKEGNKSKANEAYQTALEKFQKILKDYPKWETEIIKYRTDEIAKALSFNPQSATNPQ